MKNLFGVDQGGIAGCVCEKMTRGLGKFLTGLFSQMELEKI